MEVENICFSVEEPEEILLIFRKKAKNKEWAFTSALFEEGIFRLIVIE